MKLFVKHGIFLFATLLSLSTYSVMADEAVQSSTKSSVENMAKSTPNDVVVGNRHRQVQVHQPVQLAGRGQRPPDGALQLQRRIACYLGPEVGR